ncbi:hypothetical protein DICPUDRAFT_40818 [Dictyostelium purpureum]|uniref:Glutathione S-transferase n=1 Tax=Dictyostelium purpureum TaxID=5786 RepID=F0ZYV6_DICPU|nr:uncharacterized protein DICPUDRAFT_40818 [Dictyostelium purpureum]EGC30869.1 hypothetical protein DICPUDRAFT_40818 [Dictyostelium purpureum]|eukprot:XP_003292606.1 hypothetical protein DICPUDRAFT_40818 [Dictyostelium purpureum]
MDSKVILYGDLLSQPVRAIHWFLILNKIPFELKQVYLGKMETRTEEFKKLNPLQKMPVIKYKGQIFIESHTILRLLAQEFKLDSFYSSTDVFERCKVDTYLDWHHLGLRCNAQSLFAQKYLTPKFGKELYNDNNLDAERNLPLGLHQIEDVFLKGGANKFITGDTITIADLSCYCELEQLKGIQYDFKKYKVLYEWMGRMEQLEGYKESSVVINKVANEK